jgi:hypothetical protein
MHSSCKTRIIELFQLCYCLPCYQRSLLVNLLLLLLLLLAWLQVLLLVASAELLLVLPAGNSSKQHP